MSVKLKPLPLPDADSQLFWDGCKSHELRIQRCTDCGQLRWPARAICPNCQSWSYGIEAISGRGTVATFVVVHQVFHPAFADDVPYTIARITMDGTDGHVTLTANVVDCPWEQVAVGMPVDVVFEDTDEDCTLPNFRPSSSTAQA